MAGSSTDGLGHAPPAHGAEPVQLSHHQEAIVRSWAKEVLRLAGGGGSDSCDREGPRAGPRDATEARCEEALRAFYREAARAETDERYFRSYALAAQQGMLGDGVRTEAFRDALREACAGGGLALDLGCGSGVLAAFAARAGADRVIAVEANAAAAELATAVMRTNGLEDKVLVLQGRVEELVDVIDREIERCGGKLAVLVSEFVGFCLVHEGMFTSVAFARDRWRPRELVPRGGSVRAAPCRLEGYPQRATEFWAREHYGLDFSAAAPLALRACTAQPLGTELGSENLLAEGREVWQLDCLADSAEEASRGGPVAVDFEVTQRGALHGLCIFFTLQLSTTVALSSAPGQPSTHWKQLVVLFHAQAGTRSFPVLWPGDHVKMVFKFRLRQGRFLEVSASGEALSRGGSWPPWPFDQTWVVTPDPVIEPTAEEL